MRIEVSSTFPTYQHYSLLFTALPYFLACSLTSHNFSLLFAFADNLAIAMVRYNFQFESGKLPEAGNSL